VWVRASHDRGSNGKTRGLEGCTCNLLRSTAVRGITTPSTVARPQPRGMSMSFSASELLAALPRLRRYARILTGDPVRADDVVEETIALARLTRDVFPIGTTSRMQLFSLLRSVYSANISPNRQNAVPTPMDVRQQGPAVNAYSNEHTRQSQGDPGHELLEQFLHLPLEQREVIALVGVEGMSYDEIATLLRVPVATVISRLSQARNELRSRTLGPLAAPKSAG
jgi:RNA polymerase sigma-70 factor, ECF subfamily